MSWRVDDHVQPDATVHVWPDDDLVDHDVDGGPCPCGPTLEEQPNGTVLVTQHSLDGRERNE